MENVRRILIVDNEPDFAEALRMTIQARSYRVVTVRNRAEAQEALSNEDYDTLVLGTITPRGDAFLLHQWVKRNPRTRDMRFLVIDARPEKRLLEGWRRDEGVQLEADDYVSKPIEPAAVALRVEALLERPAERIKVLVVDDHTVVREGIRAVLTLQRDMEVVGEAEDGRHGVKQALELDPDVVLMDIVMPLMSGLEATKEICRQCPQAKILILTQYDDRENLATAQEAGAFGFIPKRAASSQLLAGIRSVHQGKRFHVPLMAG